MKSTVFILGAGASIPFGYPSGRELVDQILKTLNPNYFHDFSFKSKDIMTGKIVLHPLRQSFTDYSLYLKHGFTKELISGFETALNNSFKDSIDSFLISRKDFYEIGKFAIANCILQCEIPNEFQFVTQSWLRYLWQKINSNQNSFVSSNISFITFNYDRVVEHFFYTSLKHSFNLNDNRILELLRNKSIIHLHGKVGNFPWQDKKDGFEYDYNGQFVEDYYRKVASASKRIRLIYDNPAEFETQFELAFDLLEYATEIYAIGFGFHRLNLDRLRIDKLKVQLKCSAFGLTKHECNELERLYGDRLFLDKNNYDGLDFLRNYLPWI